ncbi:MAG: hypothetical protein RLZZ118_1172 [Bacteroidota bacterium]|jgi:integrase
MFAKKLNTLKPAASINIDTRHQKKTGLYPVRLRILYNRKYRHYPTGIDLTEIEFHYTQNQATIPKSISVGQKKFIKDTKLELDKQLYKAMEVLNDIIEFTFEEFEQKNFGIRKTINSVYDLYEDAILKMKADGRISTASNYTSSMKSLMQFKSSLTFKEVTANFLTTYEKWFLTQGKSISTVGIYLRPLRAILNIAIEEKLMSVEDYPFGKRRYQIPASKNTKKALSLEEISRIYNYEAMPNTWFQKAKDLWLFSYFANGLNITDIANLKSSNIDGDFIRVRRQKTLNSSRGGLKQINIFISPELKQIIKRWQKPDAEYIFQLVEANWDADTKHKNIKQVIKMVNKYIGLIAESVGIDKHVTTYFARHSFATVMKRSGVSTEYISESLGHSNMKTTANYLDSFEDDRHKELATVLTSFKKKNTTSGKSGK